MISQAWALKSHTIIENCFGEIHWFHSIFSESTQKILCVEVTADDEFFISFERLWMLNEVRQSAHAEFEKNDKI